MFPHHIERPVPLQRDRPTTFDRTGQCYEMVGPSSNFFRCTEDLLSVVHCQDLMQYCITMTGDVAGIEINLFMPLRASKLNTCLLRVGYSSVLLSALYFV